MGGSEFGLPDTRKMISFIERRLTPRTIAADDVEIIDDDFIAIHTTTFLRLSVVSTVLEIYFNATKITNYL